MTVELGDRVRDKVTGFDGIAIGMSRWISGCDQYAVQPCKVSKDGKVSDSVWFDVNRLDVVKKAVVKLATGAGVNDNGGPRLTH